MAVDKPASIQELKRRLALESTDSGRLAALIESRHLIVEQLPRNEAERYLREAVELARRTGCHHELAVAGISLVELYRDLGDINGSLECTEIVHEAARATGDPFHEGQYLYLMGRAHEVKGDYAPARECYERCLRVWRKIGRKEAAGAALNQLGSMALLQGQAADALDYFRECLRIDDELGNKALGATNQYNIGTSLAKLGHWEDALECYYRALELTEQHHMLSVRAYVLDSLGELFLERNKVARAIGIYHMVMEAAQRGELPADAIPDKMAGLGSAFRRRGDNASAEESYIQALALAEKHGARFGAAFVLWRLAELALEQGQLDRCRELAERCTAIARDAGIRWEEAQALRVMALMHAARDDDPQALDCFERALALLSDLEESLDLARLRFHYGRYLLARDARGEGVTQLRAAARTFRKLGVVVEAQEVNRLLFQQAIGVDSDVALLEGISGLASLGLDPCEHLARAIDMLLEALRFENAAVIVQGRAALVRGNPNLEQALEQNPGEGLTATGRMLSWPVCCGGRRLGRIYLERTAPVTVEHSHLVLDTVANLLAAPIQRLADTMPSLLDNKPELGTLRYQGVVSRNPQMMDVLVTVCAAANKDVPVLVRGESGTGKEVIARALHDSGARAGKPFLSLNCDGVSEHLLEAELFGVEPGVEAGAAARKGKFETCEGGTVLLGEIGVLCPALQVKLLRLLDEKTIVKVGGQTPIRVDVRVVGATSRPLGGLVAEGRFSEVLYRRLSSVELVLPSLNERPEDVPDLVRHFVRRASHEFGRNVVDVSPEVMERLIAHRWLGNVRELEYVVERAVLLASGDTLRLDDLPPALQSTVDRGPAASAIDPRAGRREA